MQKSITLPILTIAFAQLISWGTLYYGLTFLAGPIHVSQGWSLTSIFGAFSFGLLISAFLTMRAAHLINRFGGQKILAAGSFLSAISFCILASSQSITTFFLGWLLAGIAMAFTLYEAAFATLKEFTGEKFRRAISIVTIVGALSSTVFWPISFYANQWLGWQAVFFIFAASHLFICLPIHWWGVPKYKAEKNKIITVAMPPEAVKEQRHKIILLAISFAAQYLIAAAVAAHIGLIADANNVTPEITIFAVALIGPMQLFGRIAELIYGRRVRLFYMGMGALVIQVACLFLLYPLQGNSWLLILFALSFGIANGLMTIIRALAPAEWFETMSYAHVLGILSMAALFMRACGPVLTAMFIETSGIINTLTLLIVIGLIACGTFYIAVKK